MIFRSAVGVLRKCLILWFYNQYLVLAPPGFTLSTHEFSEVLGVYFGSAGYCGAKTNIWH